MNFLDELKWRNMVHDHTPNVEQIISKPTIGYVGIDPTADSLHVGHLVSLFIMKHFSNFGHKPIVLLGGATASVGDPSGKRKERQLLPQEEVDTNKDKLRNQIKKIMGEDILIIDNHDWFSQMSVLDFLRNVGKLTTVNVMMSKQSVKNRIDDGDGMSFTEFSYQLLQGWDFVHLLDNFNCQLQFGGSDQWGNITSGISMIQKVKGDETPVGAITCPLLTKSDGTKFGKSESGNIWIDPTRTTPFEFFQFWMNQSDEESSKLIRIFTTLDKDTIEKIESEHNQAKHLRILQRTLAEKITEIVHGREAIDGIMNINQFLFDKKYDVNRLTLCDLTKIKSSFGSIKVDKTNILESLVLNGIFKSKGDARRLMSNGGLLINKSSVEDINIDSINILFDKFIILQKGKKDFNLIEV